MTFILSEERHADAADIFNVFDAYKKYLAARQKNFPKSAYALATSDWYFNASNHQCPHDAWLESFILDEVGSGSRRENRRMSIRIVLLGAYHDCRIELFYPIVYSYSLENKNAVHGNRDWRYDEFRLSEDDHLIHEIEWAGNADQEARWIIEASDVQFEVHPLLAS